MLWCLAFYSATLLNYVPTFDRIMFGSFQLCSEVESDYPNFVWLITTLAGFLIYDFCFYYSYRIMFGSMELCSASGLELREKKLAGSPGRVHFPALFMIYSNYYLRGSSPLAEHNSIEPNIIRRSHIVNTIP